ncbi:MAG TPA: FAD:protein FMN transferase, partial [Acidimicrobiales bacterium]|nr:FAD:protein FMN transferase [Acidimicrobiales bacterium]
MDTRPPVDRSAAYRVRALGTGAELVVADPDVLEAAASFLRAELDRIDRVASRFRADSEVAHLDSAAGRPTAVSADLLELLVVAVRMARATDGAVDPTVGAAMCRLGYDRDFPQIADGVVGQLPPVTPVPGWRRITIDPSARTVRIPVGTQIDLGATAKAWLADRVAEQVF